MTDQRAKCIVDAAMGLVDPAERSIYIRRMCDGEPDLLMHVQQLCESQSGVGDATRTQAPPQDWKSRDSFNQSASDPPIAAAGPPLSSELIGGRFQLGELLGEGGMGSVWKAFQIAPVKRQVAIKWIKPGMDSRKVLARLEAERQALAMMDHQNIAKVLDGGVEMGRPYFVMELVQGIPITAYCNSNKLSTSQRIELLIDVCDAIQHAHQKGVIHRDLKPSNILVTEINDQAVPKVIDFGIAKATGGLLTDASLATEVDAVMGTPMYMSPEQAAIGNLDIDTRSDIYSLGVILYELLTGSLPFSQSDLKEKGFMELLRLVREEDPPKPSSRVTMDHKTRGQITHHGIDNTQLATILRHDLDWVVMKAIEKDRSRRYETANAMALDLHRYLIGEPVAAHPPTPRYRIGKLLRRHRGAVIATGLIASSLVLGIVGTSFGLMTARREQQVAILEKQRADLAAAREQQLRTEAEKNLLRATLAESEILTAYRTATDEAIEHLIGSKPQLGPEEKKYLEKTRELWKSIAERTGEDKQSRILKAEGMQRVGELELRLGSAEDAHNMLSAAFAITQSLVADFPEDIEILQRLPNTSIALASVQIIKGQLEEAKKTLLTSSHSLRKLEELQPESEIFLSLVAAHRSAMAQSCLRLGDVVNSLPFFRDALQYNKKLSEINPACLTDEADAWHDLGSAQRLVGDVQGGLDSFTKAIEITQQLSDQDLDSTELLKKLLMFRMNFAVALQLAGRQDASLKEMELICEQLEQMIVRFPTLPEYRRDLARAHFNVGSIHLNNNELDKAEKSYLRSLDLRRELVEQTPTNTDHPRELALSLFHCGGLYLKKEAPKEAEKYYRDSIELREQILQHHPQLTSSYTDLAISYNAQGIYLAQQGLVAESFSWFERGLSTLELLLKNVPSNAAATEMASTSLRGMAEAAVARKDYQRADELWTRAIAWAPERNRPLFRLRHLNNLLRLGQIDAVKAAIPEFLENNQLNSELHWQLSRILVGLAFQSDTASPDSPDSVWMEQAWNHLELAVKAGWKNFQMLETDDDWHLLKDDPRVQEILRLANQPR